MSQRQVARATGVHDSTVSRELRRHATPEGYDPEQAQLRRGALQPRRGAVKTITLDNGSEFANHVAAGQAVSADIYFCNPYCSGQRGSNENTNGLIRQYFPKGTDFRQVTDAELRRVVRKFNDRPRKRLGYRTPAQVFLGEYSGALDTAGAALIA